MRRKNQRVTIKELKNVHKLHKANLKNAEIAELLNIGAGTVSYLVKSNSIEEYHAKRFSSKGYKTKEPDTANTPSEIMSDSQAEKVGKALEEIEMVSLLTRIAVAVERLAEAWEKTPSKRSWLK